MKAIVLSTPEQFEEFNKLGLHKNGVLIFCDNERLYEFLMNRNMQFIKLDEFLLRDQWTAINQWGISEAAEWIRVSRESGLFKVYDYPSVIFLWLSAILISALKNYLYACYVVEKYRVDEFYVFSGTVNDSFPHLAGNATLNYFISEVALKNDLKIYPMDTIPFQPPLVKASASPALKARQFLRSVIQKIYGAVVRPGRGYDIMAFGTLRHLATSMLQLKKRGCKICFYDDQFHLEHFLFSLKAGIPYFLQSCFIQGARTERESPLQSAVKDILAALHHPACNAVFLYKNYDFKKFIEERFFYNMSNYIECLSNEESIYRRVLKTLGFFGTLLDEDFNAHAFFAEFMKKSGVHNFCISHASMALDCVVPESRRCFSQSFTFVHGQHERDTYVERGWDPAKVVVTGIPRYDRLMGLSSTSQRTIEGTMHILLCGATLWPYSPDVAGFVGISIFVWRHFQELEFRALLQAAKGLPVTITVKPHYSDDEDRWERLVREVRPSCQVRVAKATEDFSALLTASDAMVICPWSSTLIEAGIAQVPVLYWDPEHQDSRHVLRLQESGLCQIVRNANDFEKALRTIWDGKATVTRPRVLSAAQEYFLGDLTGGASMRVEEFILKKNRGEVHGAV